MTRAELVQTLGMCLTAAREQQKELRKQAEHATLTAPRGSPRPHQLWGAMTVAENLVYAVERALDDATSLQKALEAL